MTVQRSYQYGRVGTIIKNLQKMIFGVGTYTELAPFIREKIDYKKEFGDASNSDVVMAPVQWMMRTFPEAPVRMRTFDDDGEEQEILNHDLLRILETPNPFYPSETLWASTILSYAVDGNAYWLKVYNKVGQVIQLWWVPHTLISPLQPWELEDSEDDFINYYRYRVPGRGEYFIEPDGVVHFRFGQDPENPRRGLNPVKTAIRDMYSDKEAGEWTASLLKNSAVPGMIVAPEPNATTRITDAGVKQIKAYIRSQFSGSKRGEPYVSSTPMNIAQFGFSPEQMDLKNLRRLPEERISALLGIPAIVAGLGAGLDRSTFSNMAEAREMAYESVIIPTQRVFAATLKTQLLEKDFIPAKRGRRKVIPDAGPIQVYFDNSDVRVLQEDENAKETRVSSSVKAGWVRVAEARRAFNYPTNEFDEVYLRTPNMIEVLADEPRPEPEPVIEDDKGDEPEPKDDGPIPEGKEEDEDNGTKWRKVQENTQRILRGLDLEELQKHLWRVETKLDKDQEERDNARKQKAEEVYRNGSTANGIEKRVSAAASQAAVQPAAEVHRNGEANNRPASQADTQSNTKSEASNFGILNPEVKGEGTDDSENGTRPGHTALRSAADGHGGGQDGLGELGGDGAGRAEAGDAQDALAFYDGDGEADREVRGGGSGGVDGERISDDGDGAEALGADDQERVSSDNIGELSTVDEDTRMDAQGMEESDDNGTDGRGGQNGNDDDGGRDDDGMGGGQDGPSHENDDGGVAAVLSSATDGEGSSEGDEELHQLQDNRGAVDIDGSARRDREVEHGEAGGDGERPDSGDGIQGEGVGSAGHHRLRGGEGGRVESAGEVRPDNGEGVSGDAAGGASEDSGIERHGEDASGSLDGMGGDAEKRNDGRAFEKTVSQTEGWINESRDDGYDGPRDDAEALGDGIEGGVEGGLDRPLRGDVAGESGGVVVGGEDADGAGVEGPSRGEGGSETKSVESNEGVGGSVDAEHNDEFAGVQGEVWDRTEDAEGRVSDGRRGGNDNAEGIDSIAVDSEQDKKSQSGHEDGGTGAGDLVLDELGNRREVSVDDDSSDASDAGRLGDRGHGGGAGEDAEAKAGDRLSSAATSDRKGDGLSGDRGGVEGGGPQDSSDSRVNTKKKDEFKQSQPLTKQQTQIQRTLVNNFTAAIPSLSGELQEALMKKFSELGDLVGNVFLRNSSLILTTEDDGTFSFAPDKAGDALGQIAISDWKKEELTPVLEKHARKVARNTVDSIGSVMNIAINVPDRVMREIVRDGGKRVGLIDIEGDTKKAMFRALAEGRELGEGADPLARRIRDSVPAGRFRNAGATYRSKLIARTETKWAQNESSLQAYERSPDITHVVAFDAQLGADRSDPDCIARNGRKFNLKDARVEMNEEHPNGTLSFAPVVRSGAPRTAASGEGRAGGPFGPSDENRILPIEDIRVGDREFTVGDLPVHTTRPLNAADARRRIREIGSKTSEGRNILQRELGTAQRLKDDAYKAFDDAQAELGERLTKGAIEGDEYFDEMARLIDELNLDEVHNNYWDARTAAEDYERIVGNHALRSIEHREAGAIPDWKVATTDKRNILGRTVVDPADLQQVEDGMELFRRMVRQWPEDSPDWDIDFDLIKGRAGASPSGPNKTTIAINGAEEGIETYVHEMGHALSNSSNELLQESVDFLYKRTAGEDLVGMNRAYYGHGYAPSEVTRIDEFLHPYMGKEYSAPARVAQQEWGEFTNFVVSPYNADDVIVGEEIVSMGLQHMFENPVIFAQKDPEYFDFIFNRVMYRNQFD